MRFLRWLFHSWGGGFLFGLITMTMLYGFINSGQQEIINDVIAKRDSLQTVLARKHFPFPDTLIYKPLKRND